MQMKKLATLLLALSLTSSTSMADEGTVKTTDAAAVVCDYLEQFTADINSSARSRLGSTKASLDCDTKEYSVVFHVSEFAVDNAANAIQNMQSTIKNMLCSRGWGAAFRRGWIVKTDIYLDNAPLRPTLIVNGC